MLINVFGNWVNPNIIGRVYSLDKCYEFPNGATGLMLQHAVYIFFEDKTVDEVAEEINKQLKERE